MNKKPLRVISSRISLIMVVGIFLLLCVSFLVSMGAVSIIERFWDVNEDSLFLYGVIVLGISVVVGTGFSFLYSYLVIVITRPYIKAMYRIAEQDFTVRTKDNFLLEGFGIADTFNNMAEQLSSVETLRESFVSDFSHEFKTPIVSIAGFAKLLKDPNLTAEQRNEYLDVIIDESGRLVELSENVLLLNRLKTQQNIETESYSLDEQLRQCVLMLEKQMDQKDINVDLDLASVQIVSNKKLLQQLFINLINNAVKFSPNGGLVRISCALQGKNVVVSVTDNGCGMSPEVQNNIFNKFYQGDTSHTTQGNGLGLPIVKRILEIVKGDITVQSEVGKGSTFTVTLNVN